VDFDEFNRIQRSVAAAIGDSGARSLREADSLTKALGESAARSLRGTDSLTKALGESTARSLRETDSLAKAMGESAARSLQETDSLAKALGESTARSLRETDSLAKAMGESAAQSLRETDSLAKAMGESAARSLREVDMIQGFREMDSVAHSARLMGEVTSSLHDNTFKYIELVESLQRNLRLQNLGSAGITSTFRELLRQAEYKDWTSSIAEVAKQVGLAYDLVRRSGIEELRNRAELLGNLASGSPVLGMLTRDLVSSAYAGTLTPALVNGFGLELMSYIEGAEAADSEEAVEGFLQAFLAWLLVQAQRVPGTKVSGEAIFSIFLTVLTLLDSRYLDKQNDRLVKEEARKAKEETLIEMRDMEARLTEKFAQMETAGRKEYIIVQAANLRKGPGKNFESLRVLPPNLLVEEIERDGEWSHVQYFDYAEGEARDGWISITLLVARHDDDER
jgi:hypothetical protein